MKERSRTEYSLINISISMIGFAVNTIVGFICRVLFVKTLGAEYLGVGGLFTNILQVLSLAELGIGSAIIYALYKPIAEKDYNKITALMDFYKKAYMVIGIVVGVVGLLIMPFLPLIIKSAPTIKENLYVLYSFYLIDTVSSYFFSYRSALLTAHQRQYIVSGYNYIVTIIQSILQIFLLILTHEYIAYLLIRIISNIAYNIWISQKVKKDYPYILNKNVTPLSNQERKSLFINIKALTINKISGVLVNSTDNIAITYFGGLSNVGFASNYTILSSMVGSIIGLVFNALPGSIGNLNATASDEKKYSFFHVLLFLNFWLFGWGAIGIALVSSDIVLLLYGSQYVLPIYIPIIIAVNSYSIGMLQACYTYKSTLGLFRYGQYLLFLTGIINLFMDILLGRSAGTFGILFATFIARACTNLWYEPYAVFKYGLKKSPKEYWVKYFKYLFVLLCTGLFCHFACSLCNFSVVLNVLMKFIICCIIPNAIFALFFRNTYEFNYLKNLVKGILRRGIKRFK